MKDIRYYVVTKWGRQRIDAKHDDHARFIVKSHEFLRETARKIVKETREDLEL